MRKIFDAFFVLEKFTMAYLHSIGTFKRLINVYDRWCVAHIDSICSNSDYDSLPMPCISHHQHHQHVCKVACIHVVMRFG